MIRQIAFGILAGTIAVIALTLARPIPPPQPAPGEWLDTDLTLPTIARPSAPSATQPADPTDAALDVVIDKVDFKEVKFSDFIDYVRSMIKPNVVVNWRALEASGINHDHPITVQLNKVTLRTLLRIALEDCGGGNIKLGYRAEGNVISISTADEFYWPYRTVVYNVRDLLADSWPTINPSHFADFSLKSWVARSMHSIGTQDRADALVQIIQESIDPTSWRDNGGNAGIRLFNGLMIVNAYQELHVELQNLLAQLRQAAAKLER